MLEITFITSSKEKIAHAKYLSRNIAVRIVKKKNYGVAYVEPRIDDRDELIKRSVEDALLRFKKNTANAEEKLFFIEDTSVTIHALSKNGEYPGVDIKYWMKENSFDDVDYMLKNAGNDRSVTVRSDLILVFNNQLKKKYSKDYHVFTSLTNGSVAEAEIEIKTQALYPWLNDTTFNKWFIPEGEKVPVSKLSIHKADRYDFRAQGFKEMYNFLKANGFIKQTNYEEQLELFEPAVFVICGPSCAGKTTLSEYLQRKYNYHHFEASDFIYLSYHESHGIGSNVTIGDFAASALKKNPAIVTDQILRHIRSLKGIPIAITGFRSPVEIEEFSRRYKGGLDVNVIFISCDEQIRFQRNIVRKRKDMESSFEKFQKKDKQFEIGLNSIRDDFADGDIENEKTLNDFYKLFERKYGNQLQGGLFNYTRKLPLSMRRKSLENVIIQVLFDNTIESYTTTEISHLIRKTGNFPLKNKNNISRYFNQNFHPFYEISVKNDGKISYKLSQTGLSYGRLLKQKNAQIDLKKNLS